MGNWQLRNIHLCNTKEITARIPFCFVLKLSPSAIESNNHAPRFLTTVHFKFSVWSEAEQQFGGREDNWLELVAPTSPMSPSRVINDDLILISSIILKILCQTPQFRGIYCLELTDGSLSKISSFLSVRSILKKTNCSFKIIPLIQVHFNICEWQWLTWLCAVKIFVKYFYKQNIFLTVKYFQLEEKCWCVETATEFITKHASSRISLTTVLVSCATSADPFKQFLQNTINSRDRIWTTC